MKRVNLLEYFELAEILANAKRATSLEKNKAGTIYVALYRLPGKLRAFVEDENGFSACKHIAQELSTSIDRWQGSTFGKGDQFNFDKFDEEIWNFTYTDIATKIDSFRTVFEAETRDVDVYSVGEVSIYKTSALVSKGADILPEEIRAKVTDSVISEFNNAGRCLAFGLPTACGFHALRGLELVMDSYLAAFEVDTSKFKSWNDYIQAAEKLIDPPDAKAKPGAHKHVPNPSKRKPAPKVATMLDRMRELDRNPLMHPRNVLDEVGADMLYKLAAITIVEMMRDMPEHPAKAPAMISIPSPPPPKTAALPAPEAAE